MPGNTTSIRVIKQKLGEKSFAPRKSLGQNFLTDENILHKILNTGDLHENDLVLEIGPGLGALTEKLIESAGYVVAIEYDRGLFSILNEAFKDNPKLLLLNQDFMAVNLQEVFKDYSGSKLHFKVLANLPYYITTPVIFKLIESGLPWELLAFLVQKEVAERMIARPGTKEYGALTVMLSFFGRIEKIAKVPKSVFYPVPQVDSAIVRILANRKRDKEIYLYLRRVVQAAFGQRRKTILNAMGPLEIFFGDKGSMADELRKLSIDPLRRGETLSLEEFLAIAGELHKRDSKRCIYDIQQSD